MKEMELRQRVVDVMRGWLGWSEKNGKFREIIDLYNTQKPLPRGYRMRYTDEWCAATVTAAGMEAGLHDIILPECSCSRMIALYQKKGQWMEDDAYRPQIGDIPMYYWKDGKDFATTDCTAPPNHVGVVGAVNGDTMTIYEGNKGEAVATRTLQVNGRYIRGYCLPDYASKAKEESEMDQEQFDAMMEEYENRHALPVPDNTPADWEKDGVAWAVENGIMSGDRAGNLMLHSPLTRAQFVVMLKRYHDAVSQ